MLSFSPKFSVADISGVAGLLAFLADPEACAARLNELQEAAKQVAEGEAAAVRAQEEAKVALAEADKKQADTAAEWARLEQHVANHEASVRELDARISDVSAHEAALKERAVALDAQASTQAAQAADLDARAAAVKETEAAAAALKAEYEEKLDSLAALTQRSA